jgi:catechol-2,3-dioxygenase
MNGEKMSTPRLTLGHATLAARDLDRLSAFYCDVLGFEITNRGPAGPDSELIFLSADPGSHHQIAMVGGVGVVDSAFVMVDHFAFRTGTLDDLRAIHANLIAGGVEGILQICHGNAWSLYFSDCEGNGLECYVDTPFHVAQPFAAGFELDRSDEEILKTTIELIESEPEFQPMTEWQEDLAKRLDRR